MRRPNTCRRPGYTLVEILVVMGLMLLLAALAAAVGYSGLIGSQRTVGAADRASGWLLIAKQQALRDKQPRGVRFIGVRDTDPANPNAVYFREAQYIEAPEAYIPNPDQESAPQKGRIVFVYQWTSNNSMANPNFDSENGATITSREVYFVSNDTSDIADFNQRVVQGDTLVLPEFNASYRVLSTTYPAPEALNVNGAPVLTTNAVRINLQTQPDLTAAGTKSDPMPTNGRLTTLQTYKFAFQGQARALVGEPVLQLTNGLAIDYRLPTTQTALGQPVDGDGYRTLGSPVGVGVNGPNYNAPTTTGVTLNGPDPDNKVTFDILFSPSGQVIGNPKSLICLWVRNPDPEYGTHPRQSAAAQCDDITAYNKAGEQLLIVVSTRSGLISTQPVNAPPATPPANFDPYQFAKDGQNNGV